MNCWKTQDQKTEEPDRKNLRGAQVFFIASVACPPLAILLVTGILGLLEDSGGVYLLGGVRGAYGSALVFVPKVPGRHPAWILSGPTHNQPPP